MRTAITVVFLAACGPEAGQTPPLGDDAATEQWLAAGAWRKWGCEPSVHPARGNSPHGANRVCVNDAIAGKSAAASFAVGAAAVKQVFEEDLVTPTGFAVMLKTAASERRWYVRTTDGRYASGVGVPLCESCHAAARDFVFTVP